MQRYFISPEQIKNDKIVILGDDVHHIKNVMRFRLGAKILCADGSDHEYIAEFEKFEDDHIFCQIIETRPVQGESHTHVTIAQSLPKGDKLELILQKGTELGAYRFLPFSSERTVVKLDQRKIEKKVERWQKIVKEAAEQSHRGSIPLVETPVSWKQLMREVESSSASVWIAYEKGGTPLAEALAETNNPEIIVMIGPEGGFSEQEVEEAKLAGAIPISLGHRILRTETASLLALSCIFFARNELGGETI